MPGSRITRSPGRERPVEPRRDRHLAGHRQRRRLRDDAAVLGRPVERDDERDGADERAQQQPVRACR